MTYKVAALYRFTPMQNIAALRIELKACFTKLGLCGTLLIAPEGINGTLAGSAQSIDQMLDILHRHASLTHDEVKFSEAPEKPFLRLKIRLKKELITFKQESADPTKRAGQYVEARDWNALISQPDVVVVDTRNVYETGIGTFNNAVVPTIEQFTDFAAFVRERMGANKKQKIAMYCTGGIRCEKASAFMIAEGFPEVYHLKGGILKYLEEVPPEQSLWNGDCYVFDRRVAVGHGLSTGRFTMCFCCGYPLSTEDKKHPHFEDGVSCSHCYADSSIADKARFRERHQQMVE